jgi:hypothetical protein
VNDGAGAAIVSYERRCDVLENVDDGDPEPVRMDGHAHGMHGLEARKECID